LEIESIAFREKKNNLSTYRDILSCTRTQTVILRLRFGETLSGSVSPRMIAPSTREPIMPKKSSGKSPRESEFESCDSSVEVELIAPDLFSVFPPTSSTTGPLAFKTVSTAAPFTYRAECAIEFVDTTFVANPARFAGPVYTVAISVDGIPVAANKQSITNFRTTTRINRILAEIVLITDARLVRTSTIEVTVSVTMPRTVRQVGPIP
jgi:hypothetical protein